MGRKKGRGGSFTEGGVSSFAWDIVIEGKGDRTEKVHYQIEFLPEEVRAK